MNPRRAAILFAPTSVDEAKNVDIQRAIGGERMALLDPVILLDHASIAAGSEIVGFPRHPHRGIETLSYVITGEVGHKDSIGNEGIVGPGGSQWMTAGNGIYHEEMLRPGPEGAEMLQLWFSLPRASKRIPAGYLGAPSETVPQVEVAGAVVRVVAGSFAGTLGSFQDIAVRPTVLDIAISAGATVEVPTNSEETAFAYLFRGEAVFGGRTVRANQLIVFSDGDSASFTAGSSDARLLFVSATRLDEPVVQYRSFVMNTVEDIAETTDMIHDGSFAKG